MIAFERLVGLALGELTADEASSVEEHVLGCSACAAMLERILDLGERVAEVTRDGGAFLLGGHALVERLEHAQMVTRTYRIAPGGQVACTVDARDIYTLLRLSVDTRGVRRIDALYEAPSARYRFEDLPFDAERGELVFVQPAEYLRTLPTERKLIRLVAVDESGERELGAYVLNHTAFVPD